MRNLMRQKQISGGLGRLGRMSVYLGAVVICILAGDANATNGVTEINQVCAVQTGCLAGDAPGFPVEISSPAPGRSFRLTSDLVVPVTDDGIWIRVDSVSIDLNGFRIVQAGCENATSDCTPGVGTSDGIIAELTANESTIKNGSVIGMQRRGIELRRRSHVSNVTVKWSGDEGILAREGSTISGNTVNENGTLTSDAAIIVLGGGTIKHNSAIGNTGDGINASGASVIFGNSSSGNGRFGIGTGGSAATGSVIANNVTNNNTREGMLLATSAAVVANSANSNGVDGIHAATRSNVIDNVATGNSGSGIYARSGSATHRNTVRLNASYGLDLSGSTSYRENTISSNTTGTVLSGVDMGANACDSTTTCP